MYKCNKMFQNHAKWLASIFVEMFREKKIVKNLRILIRGQEIENKKKIIIFGNVDLLMA